MKELLKKEIMAYRYSNTDKWSDCWFSKLNPIEKLLFNYLCDNCDIAGFIELNQKRWASDIGTNTKTIEGALKGLGRGLIFSNSNDCIYIKNFLKHQKNLPLNDKNNAHVGILKRFELYSFKFSIQDINEFIEGASKGLPSPYGNGIGNGKEDQKKKFIYSDFYDSEILKSNNNPEYIEIVDSLFGKNNLGIPLTVLLKMPTQLNYEQFTRIQFYKRKHTFSIIQILEAMENWGNPKKRTTIYGSFQTFLKNELKISTL